MTTLFSGSITTAGTVTGSVFRYARRNIPRSISAQGNFVWSSGGTSVKAFIQSSLDGGTNWFDVMLLSFLAASAIQVGNATVSANGPVAGATDGGLASATPNNIIGDLLRCKVVSVGTYAGGTSLVVSVETDQLVTP